MGNKNSTRYVSWRGNVWRSIADTPYQQFVTADVRSYGYTRAGSNNPYYKKLIRLGVNASGSLTVNVSTAEASDFSTVVYKRKGSVGPDRTNIGTFGNTGVFFGVNLPVPELAHSGASSMDKACAMAIRVLNKNVTQRRRQVMGAVVVGELGKTLGMLLRPAKALRGKAATFTRRLRFLRKRLAGKDAKLFAKIAADTWLETTFGWKPLLSDVRDGALAVARVCQKDALNRQQFRTHGIDEAQVSATTFLPQPVGFDASSSVKYNGTQTVVSISECILYGRFSTKIQNSENVGLYASRLAQLSGFTTWEDLVPQVWELVPWSFLVDYFTNVGDVLEGFANFYNGIDWIEEVHILTTSRRRSFTVDVDYLKFQYGDLYVTHEGPDGACEASYRTVTRAGYAGPIRPELRFQLPVDMQWLNIAALVAGGKPLQAFSKR